MQERDIRVATDRLQFAPANVGHPSFNANG
jgi:hypothetical protein